MRRHNRACLLIACAASLPAAGCANGPGDQPSGADLFVRQARAVLAQVEADLPRITASAERAAAIYVENDDFGLGVDGHGPFFCELQGRSGGVMLAAGWWPMERTVAGTWKGLVLYGLRQGEREADLKRISRYEQAGSKVFLFGTRELLAAAGEAGASCEGVVEVPAAAGETVNPRTYDWASVAVGWVWTGEFVAACTRLGKMPVMFQSIAVPNGMERIKANQVKDSPAGPFRKFHETAPPAVAAGRLGREFLSAARRRMDSLVRNELPDIREAARRAVAARALSRRLYVIAGGHAMPPALSVPRDPAYFRAIRGAKQRSGRGEQPLPLEAGDFLLSIGYDGIPNGADDGFLADYARQAGATCVWSAATYRPERVRPAAGELFIDQQWEYGDAEVAVPGYDVRILPTSGLLSIAVYEMIHAEMSDLIARQESHHPAAVMVAGARQTGGGD